MNYSKYTNKHKIVIFWYWKIINIFNLKKNIKTFNTPSTFFSVHTYYSKSYNIGVDEKYVPYYLIMIHQSKKIHHTTVVIFYFSEIGQKNILISTKFLVGTRSFKWHLLSTESNNKSVLYNNDQSGYAITLYASTDLYETFYTHIILEWSLSVLVQISWRKPVIYIIVYSYSIMNIQLCVKNFHGYVNNS